MSNRRLMPAVVPGWVYVLASEAEHGIVKVGFTTRSTGFRIREIERAYGYSHFAPWIEVLSVPVSDSFHVEKTAHRMLSAYQVRHESREIFRVDPAKACGAVRAAAGSSRSRRALQGKRRQIGYESPSKLLVFVVAIALFGAMLWLTGL